MLVVANQAAWSLRQTSFDHFVVERENMLAAHEYLNTAPHKPDLILSPQYFYTYLHTGIHSCPAAWQLDLCRYEKYYRDREVWGVFDTESFALSATTACGSSLVSPSAEPLFTRGRWSVRKIIIVENRQTPDSGSINPEHTVRGGHTHPFSITVHFVLKLFSTAR